MSEEYDLYVVATGADQKFEKAREKLENEVIDFYKMGYQPIGGVTYAYSQVGFPPYTFVFFQAMLLDEDKADQIEKMQAEIDHLKKELAKCNADWLSAQD